MIGTRPSHSPASISVMPGTGALRRAVSAWRPAARSRTARKASPGSAATGTAFHFAPIEKPSAIPASASRHRAVSGSRTAPAQSHSARSVKLAIKMSSIAIRDCTNSGNAVVSSTPQVITAKRERLANHVARIAANNPSVPNSAGMIRQPSGRSPNSAMPSARISLPSGGCSGLSGFDSASTARAAGR
jgi:hypothetical protein